MVTQAAQIAAACATVFGLVFITIQAIRVRKSLQISAANGIYSHAEALRSDIVAYPETRPYLLEGKNLGKTADPSLTSRVCTLSEMLLNYLEMIEVHADGLRKSDAEAWHRFVVRSFERAPTACRIVLEHPEHYAGNLARYAREADRETG